MQRIYESENLMEGELLQGMLASEGITAHLVGRDLVGGAGELPMHGLLGLAVDDEQAQYAQELIAAYNAALPVPGDEPDSYPGTLVC
ncbi:putative signal transducing protein [Pseudomonas sp. R1-6]|uniref:putative signal transducing protein n=1 Tax=Pseudomonas sp. R1-6 TaxID=2817397 RepID=UPI003DA83D9D